MRKKALLVGAQASFIGPWVNLEEGMWEVEGEVPERVRVRFVNQGDVNSSNDNFRVHRYLGPCKIQAIVSAKYEGPEVNLSVQEVA